MPPTPHAELVIALQQQALIAIRNRLLSPSRDNADIATAIAEATHEVDGYLRANDAPGVGIVLNELERAITTSDGVIEPGLYNALNELRRALGLST